MSNIIPILVGILVFGILVLVHEVGHYIAARKCGVMVEEFAIGMGPKVFGVQRGDTLFSLRAFPLGGFCKMLGDEDESSDGRAFNNKPVYKRMIIILAGAVMNILLALIVFTLLVFFTGVGTPIVYTVHENTPAANAGIQSGDVIRRINNRNIRLQNDISLALLRSRGQPVQVRIERDGQFYDKSLTPVYSGGMYFMGVLCRNHFGILQEQEYRAMAIERGFRQIGFFEGIVAGFWVMMFWLNMVIFSVGELVSARMPVDQIYGMIGVVTIIGDTYVEAIQVSVLDMVLTIMHFTGMLNIMLGVMNLLPVPALDGGRFVFLALEGIRRKPVSPEMEGTVHFIGFVLLMLFGVFVAYNDIMRLML